MRKDSWDLIQEDESFSYCNLYKYKDTCGTGSVVTTFPEYIIDDLFVVLETFDSNRHRQKIDTVSSILVEKF